MPKRTHKNPTTPCAIGGEDTIRVLKHYKDCPAEATSISQVSSRDSDCGTTTGHYIEQTCRSGPNERRTPGPHTLIGAGNFGNYPAPLGRASPPAGISTGGSASGRRSRSNDKQTVRERMMPADARPRKCGMRQNTRLARRTICPRTWCRRDGLLVVPGLSFVSVVVRIESIVERTSM
jgi:hypothetical protein